LPWASNLPTSTTFQFRCNLAADTPVSLEPFVSIVSRADGSMLSGAFNWKQTSAGVYQLNFLPAAMVDNTDYVVTVKNPAANAGTRPIILLTGVSTGTHPQVVEAQLRSTNKAAQVVFNVRFSEEMDPTSVQSAFSVKMGGNPVTGTFATVSDGSAPSNTKFE